MPDYGPRISDDEYERRIFAIYEGLPPLPSKELERDIRRRELDAMIDHRLGPGFPKDKRAALWEVHARVEKKRLLHELHALVKSILPSNFERSTQRLAGSMVRQYSKVLSPAEIEQFFAVDDDHPPVLPFDRQQPKL